MRKVPLGEVAEVVSGATPKSHIKEYWGGDILWATPADLAKLNTAYISNTPRKLTVAGLASCAATVLPIGSVLLSSRAPIGHVAINLKPMATNQGFKSLVPRADSLDAKYLYYWLRSKTAYLQSLGNGATFKEISKATISRVEIPLPEVDKQRRIAGILDQADAIRVKRRQVLAHLDTLTRSVFHQLFSERKYPIKRLDSLVDPEDRMNYGVVQPGDHVADGVPLIRVSNLVDGVVSRADMKRISPQIESFYRRSRVRGTEILVSCVGSVGAVSLVSEEDVGSNIARAITRIPISDPTIRAYVAAFLRTEEPQRYFAAELRTVAQPTLNIRQLASTPVPVPPTNLQREFVARLKVIESQRRIVRRALEADNELFASLQARAFRGEL